MNKQEAVLFANVAQAAYVNSCSDSDFCITAKFENKATDTQGVFGEAFGKIFVIGFRGSEETGAADWITDLKFVPVAYPFAPAGAANISVHTGFVEAYSSVRDAVLQAAKNAAQKQIVCVGHSLGGALATLAALDIKLNVPGKQVSCYTFGSPRVGNTEFAALYNKQVPDTHRFVNDKDMVPTIPPLGFKHVGQLHQLGQSGAPPAGFLAQLTEWIEDHFPHNYISAMRELL